MEPSKALKQAVIDYKNGREEAFTTLYEESQKYIYVCISKIMKDCDDLPEVVSDLMQDTYVEISRHISQLENVESFLNWAGSIATRQCYAYLKKNKQYILLTEEDDTLEELAADEELIPEALMQDREKQRLIRKIIDTKLTPIQRLCVIAYYYNEQKQSEIARELGIPENTVKTHLARAKAKIREGVLELEKKEGTKLYSVAPFLLLLLGEEIRECVVPAQITAQITKLILSTGNAGAMSAAGTGAKSAAAAGKGGAAAGKGAAAAGKSGAAAAAKGGAAAALKVKIAAAVIGVGALMAVGGGLFLNQRKPSEISDEIQSEFETGRHEDYLEYRFVFPESAEVKIKNTGYAFWYQDNIAGLFQVPIDRLGDFGQKKLTDLKDAPTAGEKYMFHLLETAFSELFDPDATAQTITASEIRTINGIEMLRVEGFFTNTQQERDIDFVGYYFFREETPLLGGAPFNLPCYFIGFGLDRETDVASFMDQFAEGFTRKEYSYSEE